MRRILFCLVQVSIAVASSLAHPTPGLCESGSATLPAAADEVARRFLYAFSRNDRKTIREMLPTRLSNLYGECPFAGMPELTRPRVKKRVAAVSFEGAMADRGLPRSGLIVLRRIEENGLLSWRVRQVYWYRELPDDARLSEKSATKADREQEPAVLRAAESFVKAWNAGDYEHMDEMTFHWWESDRDPPKWVKMKHVTLTRHPTALHGIRVGFDAKLKVIGILTKRVKGDLWLVEEDGCWRVRPLTFSFAF